MVNVRFAKRSKLLYPKRHMGCAIFTTCFEAAKPIYEADRHAKKELKKQVRGVRAVERSVQDSNAPISQVVGGYCQAVRAALTDDGYPPLEAPGVKLQQRLSAIEQSLERVAKKGACANL